MSTKVQRSKPTRPIMRLLYILEKRWSLRILWELRSGRMTFRELRTRCDDMSPTSLNQRLKELRELNLIDHDEVGFGYTTWGNELGEHLLALNDWSVGWDKDSEYLGSE